MGLARPFVYLIIKEWKKVRYFLAFVLLATFVARKKLLRMLQDEVKENEDLIDLVTMEKKSLKQIIRGRK